MDDIIEQQFCVIVVIVINLVDVLMQVVFNYLCWLCSYIFGFGIVLDSVWFCYFISQEMGVDVKSVYVYIFGEYGDSEFLAWLLINLGGVFI